jgi:hypothetical protein
MLLVITEAWQLGSDAPDVQQVLGIDAKTGLVYEPDLAAMLEDGGQSENCELRVIDAGFGSGENVELLVKAKLSTRMDVDEVEAELPATRLCTRKEETWRFDYATGAITRAANSERLHLFRTSRHPDLGRSRS